jgi:hypothetical protein
VYCSVVVYMLCTLFERLKSIVGCVNSGLFSVKKNKKEEGDNAINGVGRVGWSTGP